MSYWKVVRSVGNGLFRSAMTDFAPYCRTYRIGEWTEADPIAAGHGYHLFCFDSYNAAECFCQIFKPENSRIFRCEIRDRVFSLPFMHTTILDLSGVEGGKTFDWELDIGLNWPSGTVMAKSIMLMGEPISIGN